MCTESITKNKGLEESEGCGYTMLNLGGTERIWFSDMSLEEVWLPQATESVCPLESGRVKMLRIGLDVVAQSVTVREEKGLPRVLLISANEMCVEKEETSVDVIKETAKEDINLVILS
ncbi:uncharacterized protein TNCV_2602501 [Trichonephila clavipes]|nr:uncharacterized protein TNCV_2602501 [Trichonephila clavipes]